MIPLLVETFGADRMSYVFFSICQILFPLAFIYANDHKIPAIETSLVRGMVSMVLNFAIARYYGMTLDYKYDVNFNNMLKRNIILVVHGIAITAAQFYLPMPIVHTINFFAPIFIFVIDYFENGVRISKTQFYFLFFSVLGLLCTINSELVNSLLKTDHKI